VAKKIKVDYTKCIACMGCEIACSLHHTGTVNPKKSRVRVLVERELSYPVIAGPHSVEECQTKELVTIGGNDYDGCALCRASCPVKPTFTDPDTGEALTCDLCLQCVKWCPTGALTEIKE